MAGEGASPMNPEQVAPTEAPNVTAPPAGTTPVPDQVNPFAEIMAKAEKQGLEKTLNELLTVVASEKATIPKDLQVTDEEIDNMGPEEVSKLSCKCLVRSQTYLYGQVASNRGSLQLIVVAVKFLQAMAAQMEVTFENVKDNIKIGTEGVDSSLTAFAEAFGNFINTMKDLLAGIRASSSERKALQEGFNKTLQQLEEYCKHVRGNTNDLKGSASQIKNAATNIQWELSELRTGGKTASSGAVDSNGGSMLAAIGVAIQNEATNLLEGFNKIALNLQSELGKSIQESVERGTDPEKSLKRKYEDEQQAEFQRQKEELEQAKLLKRQQERREQVFHHSKFFQDADSKQISIGRTTLSTSEKKTNLTSMIQILRSGIFKFHSHLLGRLSGARGRSNHWQRCWCHRRRWWSITSNWSTSRIRWKTRSWCKWMRETRMKRSN